NVPASRYHRGNPSSRTAIRRAPNARRSRAETRTNTISRSNPPAKLNNAAASPSSRRRPSSPLTRAWTGTTIPTTTPPPGDPHHPERIGPVPRGPTRPRCARPGPLRPKPRTVVYLVILPSVRHPDGSSRPTRAPTPPPVTQVKSPSKVGNAPTRDRNRPPPHPPSRVHPRWGCEHHEIPDQENPARPRHKTMLGARRSR